MNVLKVSQQHSIETLHRQGFSGRRIARELGLDRETVRKYLSRAKASEAAAEAKPATISPAGSGGDDALGGTAPKPATPDSNSPAGSGVVADDVAKPGRRSHCLDHRVMIEAALDLGHSAQRIFQDLVRDAQFTGSYDSVKRFVRQLERTRPLPFRRMEVEPGAELQVDFGLGAWVVDDSGKRRRPPLFRAVLSYSRKGYAEAVADQKTDSFLRALENAFRAFGGVSRTVVLDNFKGAVLRPDRYDPELNPKLREFASYYGTVILPCAPGVPRHKGKIEAGIKFTQNNALKGREFPSLAAQNLFLTDWESSVADTRIHGTTRQQVGQCFAERERQALLPLPASIFPVFAEAPRTVHRDGHVEIARAYYSVPPEYVGQGVIVRWDTRLVRIFNHRMELIATHVRAEPGRFSTDGAHIHAHKRVIVERGAAWMLERAACMGRACGAWTQAMYANRGVEGLRVLQGFLSLADDHPVSHLERAAQRALQASCWRLRDLRRLIEVTSASQGHFEFIEEHPLIRNMAEYAGHTPDVFTPSVPPHNTKLHDDPTHP